MVAPRQKDCASPADVVDPLLWRDAQFMLGRHSGSDDRELCVWCGRQWPCAPRRLAERADLAARRPWRYGGDADGLGGASDTWRHGPDADGFDGSVTRAAGDTNRRPAGADRRAAGADRRPANSDRRTGNSGKHTRDRRPSPRRSPDGRATSMG